MRQLTGTIGVIPGSRWRTNRVLLYVGVLVLVITGTSCLAKSGTYAPI
ncbi:uncharacterized protein METZ01_LOCUS454095, partial [marine metagenome]